MSGIDNYYTTEYFNLFRMKLNHICLHSTYMIIDIKQLIRINCNNDNIATLQCELYFCTPKPTPYLMLSDSFILK